LEYFHSKNYLHRDIKPDNLLIGRGNKSGIIYLIDFGLSKPFRDPSTKKHIPYSDKKKLTGTARYASITTHLGIEQSRRDDLECAVNTLIYLGLGKLPWQSIVADRKLDKYDKILDMKKGMSAENLCAGLPKEFSMLLQYCRSLSFEDKPDYGQMRKWINDLFNKNKYKKPIEYDWQSQNLNLEFLLDKTRSTDGSKEAVRNGERHGDVTDIAENGKVTEKISDKNQHNEGEGTPELPYQRKQSIKDILNFKALQDTIDKEKNKPIQRHTTTPPLPPLIEVNEENYNKKEDKKEIKNRKGSSNFDEEDMNEADSINI
jgi:serine/threonine protein kinase